MLRQARRVVSGTRPLDEDRAAFAVVPQQPDRAVSPKEGECVRLVVGLVVLDGYDLEHGVIACQCDERVPARHKALTEGNAPLACDFDRRGAQSLRHPRRHAPGCRVQPRALVAGHAFA